MPSCVYFHWSVSHPCVAQQQKSIYWDTFSLLPCGALIYLCTFEGALSLNVSWLGDVGFFFSRPSSHRAPNISFFDFFFPNSISCSNLFARRYRQASTKGPRWKGTPKIRPLQFCATYETPLNYLYTPSIDGHGGSRLWGRRSSHDKMRPMVALRVTHSANKVACCASEWVAPPAE